MNPLREFNNIYFIGVAGSGMSALAQFTAGLGKKVSGSDRFFREGEYNHTKELLEKAGIRCFPQTGEGLTEETELVVVSTAIEDTVPEVVKARELSIPLVRRSELLAYITEERKTIAIGGTSGKSTTSGMLYTILKHAGLSPGIISGAGITSLIKEGKIGNAEVGEGEWLIIEADESDGSIVQYKPAVGLLLNIDKDHQEMEELVSLFTTFKHNTSGRFIVNRCNDYSRALSVNSSFDFSTCNQEAGFNGTDFRQEGFVIRFQVNGVPFSMNSIGMHNMENAVAAVAVASFLEVSLEECAAALSGYEGIYRRNQVLGTAGNMIIIDDYAHNPVKCAAAIRACQGIAPEVIAWFQPHGYGPTRFLKNDFIAEISNALREKDQVWMSEIYYAGGTAEKNISAKELTDGIEENGRVARFVEHRDDLYELLINKINDNCVLLLMGARDPGLENFTRDLFKKLKNYADSH